MILESFLTLTARSRRPAFLLTTQGRILAVNPSARSVLVPGRQPDGGLLSEHLTDDPAHLDKALRGWAASGGLAAYPLTFRGRSGRAIRLRAEGMRIARSDAWGTPLILMRCSEADGSDPVVGVHDDRAASTPASLTAVTRAPGSDLMGRRERVAGTDRTSHEAIDASSAAAAESESPDRAEAHGTSDMQAVGVLAGGVAQEFNNLLTVIQVEIELALRKDPDPSIEPSLLAIHQASSRAAKLVQSLLVFSRRQFIESEEFDLRDLVEEAVPAEFGLFNETKPIVAHQGSTPLTVWADRTQLMQALHTLVENAREAIAEDGHIWIRTRPATLTADFVRKHPGSREGKFATLEVADDGVGVPRASLSRIFEPFFTTKGPGGARGLGLSHAYGTVKSADGYIHVESAEGLGTTVSVYLPLVEGNAGEA